MDAENGRRGDAENSIHLPVAASPILRVRFLVSSRETWWALSTLYRTHRRHGAFLVRRNCGDVFLLHVG